MDADAVAARRAIEALRAGVPNHDAVEVLGSLQTAVQDRFAELLDTVEQGQSAGGALIGGGFGSGKSHMLEHLRSQALRRGFVVSKVVVSKEVPLHDQAKVFRSAAEVAEVPGRRGEAVAELALSLKRDSTEYRDLYAWAASDGSGLNGRFAATLALHERLQGDGEFIDRIERFWAGDPIAVPELRRRLKEQGLAGAFPLVSEGERALAWQRIRFFARLCAAAGYRGFVVLLDEVELIGRYSLLQRGRSYAQVERWMRPDKADRSVPLAAVLTTVDDFEAQVLGPMGKDDLQVIPARLRAKGTEEWDAVAARAEHGMRILEREQIPLQPPDTDELDRTYRALKEIHAIAYGWSPPEVEGLERLPSNRMRQYVRAWITAWDLARLYPDHRPDLEADDIAMSFDEDVELERGGPDAEGDPRDDS